jgi:hypothetical protein
MHSSHNGKSVNASKIKEGNNSLALSKIPDVKLNIINVLPTLFYDTLAQMLCEMKRSLQFI